MSFKQAERMMRDEEKKMKWKPFFYLIYSSSNEIYHFEVFSCALLHLYHTFQRRCWQNEWTKLTNRNHQKWNNNNEKTRWQKTISENKYNKESTAERSTIWPFIVQWIFFGYRRRCGLFSTKKLNNKEKQHKNNCR